MLIRSTLQVIAMLTILTPAPAVRADWTHSVGRWAGIGWSDGYHSRTACPPTHHEIKKAEKIPWWAIPAADAQPLPAKSDGSSLPPAGVSLFRQPGEGSSVIVPEPVR